MQTKIDSEIWDDIGHLDADTKVAVFWVLTSRVDTLGYVEINPRVFAFEAGVPPSSLEVACKALPRGFVRTGRGIWLRNFMRRQYGDGDGMQRTKLRFTWFKHLREVPDDVKALVLSEYPDLEKALRRHLQAPPKGEGEGEGEGEGDRIGGAGGKEPITLAEAQEYARAWCAASPAMIAYDATQVEMWHADRGRKDWQATSGQVIATVKQAGKDLQFWLLKHKTGQSPSPPGSGFHKKNEGGGGRANPYEVPPCREWEGIAREIAKRRGVDAASIADMDWGDLPAGDRLAVWAEFKKNGGCNL